MKKTPIVVLKLFVCKFSVFLPAQYINKITIESDVLYGERGHFGHITQRNEHIEKELVKGRVSKVR